jgi:hypothetical protein
MENIMKIKTINVSAKCSDLCSVSFTTEDGKTSNSTDGYVPDFMPGEHYGDYVQLEIDVATGKILNWVVPTTKAIVRDMHGIDPSWEEGEG